MLISDINQHLVELEIINSRLREENEYLRGENVQNKNSFKVGNIKNVNKIKELET